MQVHKIFSKEVNKNVRMNHCFSLDHVDICCDVIAVRFINQKPLKTRKRVIFFLKYLLTISLGFLLFTFSHSSKKVRYSDYYHNTRTGVAYSRFVQNSVNFSKSFSPSFSKLWSTFSKDLKSQKDFVIFKENLHVFIIQTDTNTLLMGPN